MSLVKTGFIVCEVEGPNRLIIILFESHDFVCRRYLEQNVNRTSVECQSNLYLYQSFVIDFLCAIKSPIMKCLLSNYTRTPTIQVVSPCHSMLHREEIKLGNALV
jgi:hypothetical protein